MTANMLLSGKLSERHDRIRVLIRDYGTDRETYLAYLVPDTDHWAGWYDADAITHHGELLDELYADGDEYYTPDGDCYDSPAEWVDALAAVPTR